MGATKPVSMCEHLKLAVQKIYQTVQYTACTQVSTEVQGWSQVLKYVTSTTTRNFMMYEMMSHKAAILVKPGHFFMQKVSSGFPSDVHLLQQI